MAWFTNWNYRKAQYQILDLHYQTIKSATLVTAGKMRSDCGDIRFTDDDGSTLIYIYYGNSAGTYDNLTGGTNTFILFDDFSGTSLDTSKWQQVSGTCAVTVNVTWTNNGGTNGDFIPNITIDGTPYSSPYPLESLGAGLPVIKTFVISGRYT